MWINSCVDRNLTHTERLNHIESHVPLECLQREFLQTCPPTDIDTVAPQLMSIHNAATNVKNTTCMGCSYTGVLSHKQMAVQSGGSIIAFDPEIYTLRDQGSNFFVKFFSSL